MFEAYENDLLPQISEPCQFEWFRLRHFHGIFHDLNLPQIKTEDNRMEAPL